MHLPRAARISSARTSPAASIVSLDRSTLLTRRKSNSVSRLEQLERTFDELKTSLRYGSENEPPPSLKLEPSQSLALASFVPPDYAAMVRRFDSQVAQQESTITRLKNNNHQLTLKLKRTAEEQAVAPILQEKLLASNKAVAFWQDQAHVLEKKLTASNKRIIKLETALAKHASHKVLSLYPEDPNDRAARLPETAQEETWIKGARRTAACCSSTRLSPPSHSSVRFREPPGSELSDSPLFSYSKARVHQLLAQSRERVEHDGNTLRNHEVGPRSSDVCLLIDQYAERIKRR